MKTWGRIGRDIKKQRGGSVSGIQISHNNIYYRYEGKELLEAGLQKALSEKFKLTKVTPTWSGQLQQDFGLLGNTTSAYKVLEGTYVYPKGLSESVVRMLHMIGELAVGIKDMMVDIVITLQDYNKYRKGCMEKTSSSVYDPHFGHWKAAESRNQIAELHTMFTQMEFQSGTPLTQ